MKETEKIILFMNLKAATADLWAAMSEHLDISKESRRFADYSSVVDILDLYDEYLAWLETDAGKDYYT